MAVYADSKDSLPLRENYVTEPLSPYGISKLSGEKYSLIMCRNFGISCVVLRYFNTFGRRQILNPYVGVMTIFINQLLRDESPVVFGDGSQTRDFVSVEDVAESCIRAMEADVSGVLNIGSGNGTTINDLAKILRDRINPSVSILHQGEQQGELKFSVADITKAESIIGYVPQYKLEDKIDEIIEFNKRLVSG